MKILSDLNNMADKIESGLGITIKDRHFKGIREGLMINFLNGISHAAVQESVPWLEELDEESHILMNLILSGLLAKQIAREMSLPELSPDDHYNQILMYEFNLMRKQFDHLSVMWEYQYWPEKDMKGMALYIKKYLKL